jgi:hypothetical protein
MNRINDLDHLSYSIKSDEQLIDFLRHTVHGVTIDDRPCAYMQIHIVGISIE